ncbi:AraC family transcriptional regulator [Leptolyngbya sp. NK1-12]|uniref:AraC family transcriptional regulator n=1 Tax=Leptolyngbya sp. NK1-12 TaxID=2547451 RepID=A0AA96WBN6_9CYAN|nr:AraC family transcriptional regulator [Leptolyngbya sp. NK1-12]WNZ21575.1 AraC family transcriptional regulator [Leptolyngbya sp. NK1-12]
MDVVTEVLRGVRLDSQIWGRLELSAPWGLQMEGLKESAFYVVTEGSCVLQIETQDPRVKHLSAPRVLQPGDLVILLQGYSYRLSSLNSTEKEALPAISLMEVLEQSASNHQTTSYNHYRYGGGGDETHLVSGCFFFCNRQRCPLLSALPTVIHLTQKHIHEATGSSAEWFTSTIEFLACEATSTQLGAPVISSRLAEIMFIQVVRTYLAKLPDHEQGWLRAVVDPQIGQALALIHQHLNHSWTVEELAQRVDMSRAAFAAKFRQLVGEPPLQYITRWRMQEAATVLQQNNLSVVDVALAMGYESESAFNKAFKRCMGETPGTYRKKTTE